MRIAVELPWGLGIGVEASRRGLDVVVGRVGWLSVHRTTGEPRRACWGYGGPRGRWVRLGAWVLVVAVDLRSSVAVV